MIMIHIASHATSAPIGGGAWIYLDGVLVARARAATDAEAVREAVRMFRLTRPDRLRERRRGLPNPRDRLRGASL